MAMNPLGFSTRVSFLDYFFLSGNSCEEKATDDMKDYGYPSCSTCKVSFTLEYNHLVKSPINEPASHGVGVPQRRREVHDANVGGKKNIPS